MFLLHLSLWPKIKAKNHFSKVPWSLSLSTLAYVTANKIIAYSLYTYSSRIITYLDWRENVYSSSAEFYLNDFSFCLLGWSINDICWSISGLFLSLLRFINLQIVLPIFLIFQACSEVTGNVTARHLILNVRNPALSYKTDSRRN